MFTYKGGKNFKDNNTITLLKDADAFIPQLVHRIRQAEKEIFLETFILEDDRVGKIIKHAVIAAAKRGVWVGITADSYGAFHLTDHYIESLSEAGVVFQIYDPQPKWFNARPKLFRRLHRKLAVVDSHYAFVGGINFSEDHITRGNNTSKRDYTAEVIGPVVADIRKLCASYVRESPEAPQNTEDQDDFFRQSNLKHHHDARVAFISRDNHKNRSEIEKGYIDAIRRAKHSITLANAYFFPGFRMMRALRKASHRGVKVRLILQGRPDIPFALRASQCLYDTLLRAKIEIYEYVKRPLHAKVAIIDNQWSSIGSSNLDPWSLSLNLEANLFVEHEGFNQQLEQEMEDLIQHSQQVKAETLKRRDWLDQLRNTFFYHLLRRVPSMVSLIPNPNPNVQQIRRAFKTTKGASKNRGLHKDFPESQNARQVVIEKSHHTLEEAQ